MPFNINCFIFIISGKIGPKTPLPDHVVISEPKLEEEITKPYSDVKGIRPPMDPNQPLPAAVPQQ